MSTGEVSKDRNAFTVSVTTVLEHPLDMPSSSASSILLGLYRYPADDSTKTFENSMTIQQSKRCNIPEDVNSRQHRYSNFIPRKLQLTLGMSPCTFILCTLTRKAVLFFVFMQRRIAVNTFIVLNTKVAIFSYLV